MVSTVYASPPDPQLWRQQCQVSSEPSPLPKSAQVEGGIARHTHLDQHDVAVAEIGVILGDDGRLRAWVLALEAPDPGSAWHRKAPHPRTPRGHISAGGEVGEKRQACRRHLSLPLVDAAVEVIGEEDVRWVHLWAQQHCRSTPLPFASNTPAKTDEGGSGHRSVNGGRLLGRASVALDRDVVELRACMARHKGKT